jgi:hypothetical protein
MGIISVAMEIVPDPNLVSSLKNRAFKEDQTAAPAAPATTPDAGSNTLVASSQSLSSDQIQNLSKQSTPNKSSGKLYALWLVLGVGLVGACGFIFLKLKKTS